MSRSVHEILQLNPNKQSDYEIIDKEYIPHGISSIKIGGKPYTNYGAFWFFWEKTYVKSPTRSSGGAMTNINNVSTFLTGHLVIDFSIISIDDYRSIMRSHYEQNEFLVECYDFIYNKIATLKMYFATEEKKKLYIINKSRLNNGKWEEFLVLAGVQDYQLEMIGTNNDFDTVSVVYNLNAPEGIGVYTEQIGGQDVAKGGDFICGSDIDYSDITSETFNGRYKFVGWNDKPDGSGQPYIDGYAYTLYDSIVLYAIWESAESLTLSYSYGLSTPMTDASGKPVYSKPVKKGESIGVLPSFEACPKVTIDKVDYFPYTSGAWYKTAIKAPNSVALQNNTAYWSNTDSQIYLLYDTIKYKVSYYVDGAYHSEATVEYNTAISFIEIYKTGHTLSGWYIDEEMKKSAPTVMPPYDIKLYAKWNKN